MKGGAKRRKAVSGETSCSLTGEPGNSAGCPVDFQDASSILADEEIPEGIDRERHGAVKARLDRWTAVRKATVVTASNRIDSSGTAYYPHSGIARIQHIHITASIGSDLPRPSQ